MGYVAVRGGEQAIANAETLLLMERAGGASELLTPRQIREQLYLAVDRVMGEGSLYAPDLAALAFKQAAGDTFEAAFILRSYRTTLPRIGYAEPAANGAHADRAADFGRLQGDSRRPGPRPHRGLHPAAAQFRSRTGVRQSNASAIRQLLAGGRGLEPLPESFPKVVEMLRREGLLVARHAPAGPPPRV
jgi:alpha-D-ribose 1-methylphosphonate 5-triphosphate synthase subunit PhnI